MLWGEYNYDEDIAAQRQEAFDDGVSQGIQQKAIETAKNFLSMGLQKEQAYPLRLSNNLQRIFHNNVKNYTKQSFNYNHQKKGFSILGKSLFFILIY